MKLSRAEKQQFINEALIEYGLTIEELSYQEGVKNLRNYLKIEDNVSMLKKFGEYIIVVENYECITESEIEEGRKILSKLNKGIFSKSKIYTRTFANVKLRNKGMVSLVIPNQILWELSGVSKDTVEDVAQKISAALGIAFKVC